MTARLAAALLALVLLAACGEEDDAGSAAPPAATPTPTPTAAAAGRPPSVSRTLGRKPRIGRPEGEPPAELVVRDIVRGDGARAEAGDTVSVQYVGVAWSTGRQFDASWDRGEPFSFPLGGGQVIAGWDQGVEGMRVGGRRELVIPPDLAYGTQPPPGIEPNETLVFAVDLLRVR